MGGYHSRSGRRSGRRLVNGGATGQPGRFGQLDVIADLLAAEWGHSTCTGAGYVS